MVRHSCTCRWNSSQHAVKCICHSLVNKVVCITLRIAISACPTCVRRHRYGGSRRNIAMSFGTEKLEWLGYPTVKNVKIYLFLLTQSTNVTDGHTDTAWRHRAAKKYMVGVSDGQTQTTYFYLSQRFFRRATWRCTWQVWCGWRTVTVRSRDVERTSTHRRGSAESKPVTASQYCVCV